MECKEKISRARNAGTVPEIFDDLSINLASLDELNYVKIYNGKILASNYLSDNGKKQPVTQLGMKDIVGVELLVDASSKVIQFFSLTSSIKGGGEKIVNAVFESIPNNWTAVVVMDSSGGFWQLMRQRYPTLIIM
ncbi:hypothetical protein [Shewanella surugensis]|uniref:Mutator family transposase n=1 Tax=Shewanella surugensis TaxID=212020 RepID=A0ABT0L6T3_9GAMM|nr:hypothetical protein [Shewanella surugensis]MCL1123397.1 hypothetical protein [Shewanella surugensis]